MAQQNIWNFVEGSQDYASFNREERNLAAIFFHTLQQEGKLQKFLDFIGCRVPVDPDVFAVYFEYAYLRDLWSKEHSNEVKRDLILRFLKPSNEAELSAASVQSFNEYFGAVPKPSEKFIQSPSNWSVSRFSEHIPDHEEFLRTCKFKWAFNAKPDLVIQLNRESCVCIEAKLESGVGSYPSSSAEKAIFNKRGLGRVRQTILQEYMLSDLLGYQTQFVILSKKKGTGSDTHEAFTWKAALKAMDTAGLPDFMLRTIDAVGRKG